MLSIVAKYVDRIVRRNNDLLYDSGTRNGCRYLDAHEIVPAHVHQVVRRHSQRIDDAVIVTPPRFVGRPPKLGHSAHFMSKPIEISFGRLCRLDRGWMGIQLPKGIELRLHLCRMTFANVRIC